MWLGVVVLDAWAGREELCVVCGEKLVLELVCVIWTFNGKRVLPVCLERGLDLLLVVRPRAQVRAKGKWQMLLSQR